MRTFAWFVLIASWAHAQTPVERALSYLSAEVPKWRDANGCFSCHNNGDGARALYAARAFEPARSTTAWLSTPAEWDKRKTDNSFDDKTLALYQFAAALTSAFESGALQQRAPLEEVARKLVSAQHSDGSWRIDDGGDAPGSPVTWETTLATYFGLRTLRAADGPPEATRRAENWLRNTKPRYLLDEAGVLLALPADPNLRTRAIDRFAKAQTSDGGWGPTAGAPAEVFDTAVVMLSLQTAGEKKLIPRAREFLVRSQSPSGGWPETTRPSGSQSYAQHISTTSWAALALLATDPQRNR